MIDFKTFESTDDSPIYSQIINFVKREIIADRIKNGDIMPSRRVLSSLIGVNPNTIQKSYKLLEEEGIIISQSGAKSVITIDENNIEAIREEMIKNALLDNIKNLKHMGISKEHTLKLIEKLWED